MRRHRRYRVDEYLQVSWLDMHGQMRITRTRAVDVSEDGISFQLPAQAMPVRIQFRSDHFKIAGMGMVRHCHREGTKFVVGLEFAEGLHWQPPSGEVREPIPLCDPQSKK
jgi:hypothetical protein